jgi:predicted cupin superfamily sugar epimerase
MTAEYWIARLRLERHPEGGYFAETYRSAESLEAAALPLRYDGPRACSTAIYFLLPGDEISALHRLRSDELWHFHAGSAATIVVIEPGGALREVVIGPDAEAGQVFQATMPAGCWFGARVNDPASYTLVGCTVAPGFSYEDFELGDRRALLTAFPRHRKIIEGLTRPTPPRRLSRPASAGGRTRPARRPPRRPSRR